MKGHFLLPVAFALGLSGCQALQKVATVNDAQTAVGQVASAVNQISDPNASVLSKAQAASCAGQAATNAVIDMLNGTGHQGAANNLTKVSAALGYGCTWTLPMSLPVGK
jgi:hypothetical protein